MKEGGDVRKMYPGVWTMDCVRGGKVISIQDNHSWCFPSTMLWPYKKFVFQKISIFLNGKLLLFQLLFIIIYLFIYFYYYDDDIWPWISMVEEVGKESPSIYLCLSAPSPSLRK